MLSASLVEQIKCRWREFLREPSAFFWVVFMPLLWMLILGFSFSNPKPEIYSVGWSGNDSTRMNLLETLETNDHVKVVRGDPAELSTLIKRGDIQVILHPSATDLAYRYDASNPTAVRANEKVDDLLQRSLGRQDPLVTSHENLTAKGSRYVDFLIPGLLGLSVMTSSLFGVAMTLVSNRRENLLKRYRATPMRPYEYIVSHIVGRFIVLATEFAAVMLGGWLIFGFVIEGNLATYVVISLLGAAAFTSVAMVCGSRTKSIPTVSGLTNIISMPMMMLSGVFFSTANFPDWMQQVVKFLPLTALIDALRKVALEAQGFHQLGFELAVMAVYTVVGVVAATKMFKWY